MANDLITRLVLDSKGFDQNLQKSTKQVQDFQKVTNNIKGGIGTLGISFTKLVPQLALLTGGITAADTAFKGFLGSSQGLSDGIEKIKGSVDSLVASLTSNVLNGSLDNFFKNLGNVIDKAKLSAQAKDALASSEMHSKVMADYYKAEVMELKNLITVEKDANKQQELQLKGEESLRKYKSSANTYKNRLKDVAVSNFEDVLANQTIGGFTFKGRAVTDEEWENFLGITEEDAAKMAETFETNFNKYTEQLAGLNRKKAASANPQQYLGEIGAVRNKIQKYIDDHPLEWAIFGSGKSNEIEEALGFVRTVRLQIKGIDRDIASIDKKFHESAESAAKIADNVKGKFIDKLQGGWNIKINGKNLFDNNKLIEAVKVLPDEIAKALDDTLSDIEAQQKLNNLLYESGKIDTGTWQKKNEQIQSDSSSKLQEIARQAFLVQGKKASKETTIPILSQIASWMAVLAIGGSGNTSAQKGVGFDALIDVKETYAQSVEEALAIGNPEQRLSALSSLQKNIKKDMEKAAQQVNGYALRLYDAADSLFKNYGDNKSVLYDKLKELGFTDVENIKAPENGVFNIDEHSPEINRLYEKLSDYNDLYLKLGEAIEKATQQAADLQDMVDFSSGIKSITAMNDAISNTFAAAGEDEAAFFFKTLGDLSNMIAEYANLAVIKAAAGASSAPWPYTIAAIATAVTTTAAIAANAMQTFANGGIVQGGSYSGDQNLVRVNAGEMILNGSQQANLFRMLNGEGFNKSTSVAVTGTLKASGRDLIAVIGNTNNKYGKL